MQEDPVERYMALCYGYSRKLFIDKQQLPKNREEEEFFQTDRQLEALCGGNHNDATMHMKKISDRDEYVVYERMIGDWTYRFKSRFFCDESDTPSEVHQSTQIVPPSSMNLKPIDLPLRKDLGEAGCVFQSAVVLCNLLTDRNFVLHQYMNSQKKVVEVGSGTGVRGA